MHLLVLLLALLLPALSLAQAPVFIPPPGPTGPAGPEGAQGPAGADGADGAPGADGADGIDTQPLIATFSPSAASNVSITGFVSADYIKYRIEYWGTVSADDQELWLHTDSDGGASYDASAANYVSNNQTINTGGAVTYLNGTTSHIVLTEDGAGAAIGNASGESVSGSITIEHLGTASTQPLIRFETTYVDATARAASTRGAGTRVANAAIDAIEIDPEGATTFTGEVRVYGIRTAN